jgi:acyl-coenzyme A thioesterase PaaI-like protein
VNPTSSGEGLVEGLIDDGMCFGCGPDNPIGLRLTFAWNDTRYETRWTPQAAHQGWAGRAHGGMVALVLDEILSRAALTTHGLSWVTAELTTRLVRPARIGVPLVGQSWVQSARPRLIVCFGEVREEESGLLIATGQAKMMPVKPLKKEQL